MNNLKIANDDEPVVKPYIMPDIIDDMDNMRFSGHPNNSGPMHNNINKNDALLFGADKDKIDSNNLQLSDICEPMGGPPKLQM
jgi:hypothetical protein